MLKGLILFSTTILLSSCGNNTNNYMTISGNVADGYLRGATVCLDINSDKICNNDEPETTIENKSEFSLTAVAFDYPIIAIISTSTYDEDDTSKTISKLYVLSAPKGKSFISPITTIIQNEIEIDLSLSISDAANIIKELLNSEGDGREY